VHININSRLFKNTNVRECKQNINSKRSKLQNVNHAKEYKE